MLALVFSGQAFTSPATHVTMSTRAAGPSMLSGPADSVPRLVGLGKSEWPSVYDQSATMGEFVKTYTGTTDDAVGTDPSVRGRAPLDSVPKLIGLGKTEWPSVYDQSATMGEFVKTYTGTTDDAVGTDPSVRGRAPLDSVPKLIGLGRPEWPSTIDSAATLGGFVVTPIATAQEAAPKEIAPEAETKGVVVPTKVGRPYAPVDSVPAVVGLDKSSWPSTYDKSSNLGKTYNLAL